MHTINRWTFQSSFSAQHARTNTSTQKANNQENAPKLFQSKHKWSHTNQKDQSVYDLLCLMNYYCFNSVFVRWSMLCTLFSFFRPLTRLPPLSPLRGACCSMRSAAEAGGEAGRIERNTSYVSSGSASKSCSFRFSFFLSWSSLRPPRDAYKKWEKTALERYFTGMQGIDKKDCWKRPTCMRKKTLLNKMLLLNVYQRVTSEFDSAC